MNFFGQSLNPLDQKALKQLKENSSWYLGLGILSVIVGTLALIYSFVTTIFSVIYIGALLLTMGIIEFAHSFKLTHWNNFFLHIFLGIIFATGGIFIILYPTLNAITLTLALAIFLVVAGLFRIFFSISSKIPHKGWLLLNGLLNIILGVLIWAQWPSSGLWVIGMLVAIDAIFTGWTWIILSVEANRISIGTEEAKSTTE
jgi:uncharacterized membrane protein HdeD (DUF308 family)